MENLENLSLTELKKDELLEIEGGLLLGWFVFSAIVGWMIGDIIFD